jgi:hypothetical protein
MEALAHRPVTLSRWLPLAVLLLIALAAAALHLALPATSGPGSDIYYSYVEGGRIAAGQDPYTRILAGNMRDNDKYATYFPLFYLLSALTQRLGLEEYGAWIGFWRIVFLLCNVGAACVLYWMLYRRRARWLALAAVLFWFFSRWNLQSSRAGTNDFVAIFCLLLSLALLERSSRHGPLGGHWPAYLLFGLSLGLKQIGAFLAPLYLIYAWQAAAPGSAPAETPGKQIASLAAPIGEHGRPAAWLGPQVRALILAALTIGSVPMLTSLPFLLTDAGGFVRSIAFSVTRGAATPIDAPSLDSLLGISGPLARLPMLCLLIVAYLAFWRREFGLYRAGLLVIAVFLDFNSVLFLQYFCWLVPFVPLAAVDTRPRSIADALPTLA